VKYTLWIRFILGLLLVGFFFYLIYPFFHSIFFSSTLSLALGPYHSALMNRGFSRRSSAIVLTLFFTHLICLPLTFLIIRGFFALSELLEKMSLQDSLKGQGAIELFSHMKEKIIFYLKEISDKTPLFNFLNDKLISSSLSEANQFLISKLKLFLSALPTNFLSFIVFILGLYLFLLYREDLKLFIQKTLKLNDDELSELTKISFETSRRVYVSNLITGLTQSLIIATAVSLLGVSEFFIIFFITLIFSFVPVIGASPMAFICCIYLLLVGQMSGGIILLVVGLFAGVVDNFMRPWLMSGGHTPVPAGYSFISVVGAVVMLGFSGLFVGLFISTFLFKCLSSHWTLTRFTFKLKE
jgi:predicted PurR-regulated permease PerM